MLLNVLFSTSIIGEIKQAYISKVNSECKDKVVLLMITDGEKLQNLTVKKLIALWRGITSKFNDGYYCIICLYSFKKEKRKSHEYICKSHDYYHVNIPEEYNNILKYNQDEESMKIPFVIYVDMKSLFEKI